MGGISFQANDLCGHGHLVFWILGYGQVDLAADVRQMAGQVNKRARGADIVGQAFLDDFLAAIVLPANPYRERNNKPFTVSSVLYCHGFLTCPRAWTARRAFGKYTPILPSKSSKIEKKSPA